MKPDGYEDSGGRPAMNVAPTVSVVIPTRDRRELLTATLDSLEGQTQQPVEVVVVSDGSCDGTDERVLERARSSPQLRLVSTPGIGPGGARNAGWRISTGDLVAFIDDDCTATPGWIEALTAAFVDPSIGIVQGRTLPAAQMGPHDRSISVTSEYGLYESCNIGYRRAALEEVGGFDELFGVRTSGRLPVLSAPHFGEDTDLAWRVKRAGWKSIFCDAALVHHGVFARSYLQALRQEWGKSLFPYLIREIPEIRDLLPAGPYFLRRQSPLAQLAFFGLPLLATRRRLLGMAMITPYLTWVSRRRRPVEASQQAGRDLVASAALVVGSAWYRRLLL